MKHAIALTLVVTALGAAPVLSAEMGAEDFGRTQLAGAAAAKVSVRDAIAAAESLSNGGRVVEATYYLQRTPPSATYELRAYQKDGMWEARIAAGSGEMLGVGRTTPRGMFDEADAAELALRGAGRNPHPDSPVRFCPLALGQVGLLLSVRQCQLFGTPLVHLLADLGHR